MKSKNLLSTYNCIMVLSLSLPQGVLHDVCHAIRDLPDVQACHNRARGGLLASAVTLIICCYFTRSSLLCYKVDSLAGPRHHCVEVVIP